HGRRFDLTAPGAVAQTSPTCGRFRHTRPAGAEIVRAPTWKAGPGGTLLAPWSSWPRAREQFVAVFVGTSVGRPLPVPESASYQGTVSPSFSSTLSAPTGGDTPFTLNTQPAVAAPA